MYGFPAAASICRPVFPFLLLRCFRQNPTSQSKWDFLYGGTGIHACRSVVQVAKYARGVQAYARFVHTVSHTHTQDVPSAWRGTHNTRNTHTHTHTRARAPLPQSHSAGSLLDIGTRRIFTEDHDLFRESARKFFDEECKPYTGLCVCVCVCAEVGKVWFMGRLQATQHNGPEKACEDVCSLYTHLQASRANLFADTTLVRALHERGGLRRHARKHVLSFACVCKNECEEAI